MEQLQFHLPLLVGHQLLLLLKLLGVTISCFGI